MIYITGDCHADFTKFNTENFPEQAEIYEQIIRIV